MATVTFAVIVRLLLLCQVVCTYCVQTGYGGEALSRSINYSHTADFAAAGYADLVVSGVVRGKTRQYGLFSFTRVFEAGHQSKPPLFSVVRPQSLQLKSQ